MKSIKISDSLYQILTREKEDKTYGEFIGELIETQWSRLTLRDIESLLADIVQSLTLLTEEKSLEEWQDHENVGFHCPTCAKELEYYEEERNEGRELPEVGMRCPDCDFKLRCGM